MALGNPFQLAVYTEVHEEVIHILGVHKTEVFPPGPQELHELAENTKVVL